MKVTHIRNHLKDFVSTIFFIACATYVAVRGYKCFIKFLRKPQSNHISYEFTPKVIFPSISFCPAEEFQIKIEELNKCNLTVDDYFTSGQWIGKSENPNCKDPKILHQNLMPKLKDLNIEWIEFKTFQRKIHYNFSSGMHEIIQGTNFSCQISQVSSWKAFYSQNLCIISK